MDGIITRRTKLFQETQLRPGERCSIDKICCIKELILAAARDDLKRVLASPHGHQERIFQCRLPCHVTLQLCNLI